MEPCWPLVRTKYREGIWGKGGFCWVSVIFRFLVVLAFSWHHFGSILEGPGLSFGGFWAPFWEVFGLQFGGC